MSDDLRYMTRAQADVADIDVGLRQYMLRVYNYMASGVALTGIVSAFVSQSPELMQAILGGPMKWVLFIGIIGLGNIGKAVAHRARAFHMPILYHNRSRDHESEVNFNASYCADLDELLATSDIVSIHCPLSRDTQDLIDHRALKTMKSSSILINTSRGGVVNEDALIQALDEGTISGAGLDVYENEPNVRQEFRKLNNIILSPHVGTATSETRNDMGFRVVENIETFFATGVPKDLVSP